MTGQIYIASKGVFLDGSPAKHLYLVYASDGDITNTSNLRIIRGGQDYNNLHVDNLVIETGVLIAQSEDAYNLSQGESHLTRGSVPLDLDGRDASIVWGELIDTALALGSTGKNIYPSYANGGIVRDTGLDYEFVDSGDLTNNSNATIRSILAANGIILEDNLPLNLTFDLAGSAPGHDTIYAGANNDELIVGDGVRYINGDTGNDTADFTQFSKALTVNLGSDSFTGSGVTGEIINVENAIGTNFNDTITGNASNNILNGGAGIDTLNGGDGDDTFKAHFSNPHSLEGDTYNGGNGIDTIDYSDLETFETYYSDSFGIAIDLAAVSPFAHPFLFPDNKDFLVSIEKVIGTAGRDDVRGSTNNEIFDLGAGLNLVWKNQYTNNVDSDTFIIRDTSQQNYIQYTSGNDVIELQGISTSDFLAVSQQGNEYDSTDAGCYFLVWKKNGINNDFSFENMMFISTQDLNYNWHGDYHNVNQSDIIKFRNPDGSLVSLSSLVIGDVESIWDDFYYPNPNDLTDDFTIGDDQIFGNFSNETLNGGAGNDEIDGDAGDDILNGGAGDDDVHGGLGNDTLNYFYNENTSATDEYFGDHGNDTLVLSFNSGDLTSGIKQDIVDYRNFLLNPTNVDELSDSVGEFEFSDIGLTVTGIENLSLVVNGVATSVGVDAREDNFSGALNTNITGNLLSDNGNGADSSFIGTINATAGTFTTAQGGTIVISSNGSFTYTPPTSFTGADSYTYSADDGNGSTATAIAHFMVGMASTVGGTSSNDTLTGTSASELLSGGSGNDTLNANDGNDILNGGSGNDTMNGGNGNDTYIVDSASDTVSESASAGTDLVQTSVNYTLTNNVENLLLAGIASINGTGNSLNNTITGNAGNNILDGSSGSDTLIGGAGDDTYIVDTTSDVITENSNEGIDTVSHRTVNDYTLGVNIENMTMDRPDNMNGWGNGLNNIISGTAYTNNIYGLDGNDTLYGFAGNDNLYGGNGNDFLDAGEGNDSLLGGAGDDIMVVDSGSDSVVENASEGTDTIQSHITYTLATNFENLTLLGSSNINATGNSVNNVIIGNIGNNTLDGGAGNDTLSGGAGNDIYTLDSASDTVTENANEGTDTVQTSLAHTLGSNVENLTITSSSSVNGTGNSLDNVITGNSGVNTLTGNDGNDTLDGGSGNDTLIGGLGNDTYIVDSNSDVVTENSNEGSDIVLARTATYYTLGSNVENLTLDRADNMNGTGNSLGNTIIGTDYVNTLDGLAGNDYLQGKSGNDTLYGGDGNDILDGGNGNDTMVGGTGDDDYIVDSASDSLTENASEGTDSVYSFVTHTLQSNFENLILTGTSGINGTGNSLDNTIIGNSANNTLDGNSGNDFIDGGAGNDAMYGGSGDDTFIVDSTSDSVNESASSGTDSVQASATFTLGSNVENLILTGASAINGTGNSLNNTITGNAANNIIDGGSGNDTMIGGLGDDTYIVDSLSDVVTESASEGTDTLQTAMTFTLSYANVENLTLTGSSAINGTGNSLDNYITGNSNGNTLTGGDGNDTLDGGANNDTLIGGTGNDTYIVDHVSDAITENSSEGTDTVSHRTPNDYTLAANIENMTMDRPDNMNGWGNSLNNIISGTAYTNNIYGLDGNDSLYGYAGNDNLYGGNGNDFLDAGEGNDSLLGGAGDDIMVVDSASDSVVENASEGTDTVQSSINYSLGSNVENLTLIGSSNINGTGNSVNNIITGNNGNNTLDGGSGIDTLIGGLGNDTYIVDTTTDTITENSSEGTDTIQTAMTYTLATANVENLTLTGSSNINGTGDNSNNTITGNSGNNTLTGNGGNDTLDGGNGNDTLIGGTGDDIYIVDSVSDVITESSNEGIDTVYHRTANNYTLDANVENMIMDRVDNMNGWGNSLDNSIKGTSQTNNIYGLDGNDSLYGYAGNDNLYGGNGNDFLDAGEGADSLLGGAGDDIMIVDHTSDSITENASEGTDTVQSSINYTLGSNVENLTLTGTSGLTGTGNSLANTLTGNSGANTLSGGDGNDTIAGKAGVDALTGGNNADTFIFDDITFGGADTISDFNTGQTDKLDISDLLIGYNPGTSNIDDFATLNVSGGNTTLLVDRDGAGSAYNDQSAVTLTSVTGLNLADMLTNGHLLVT